MLNFLFFLHYGEAKLTFLMLSVAHLGYIHPKLAYDSLDLPCNFLMLLLPIFSRCAKLVVYFISVLKYTSFDSLLEIPSFF